MIDMRWRDERGERERDRERERERYCVCGDICERMRKTNKAGFSQPSKTGGEDRGDKGEEIRAMGRCESGEGREARAEKGERRSIRDERG